MLACAYFDDMGNIMVTNEGLLPSEKIAKRFSLEVSCTAPVVPDIKADLPLEI